MGPLRDADIEQQNLVSVSSILPPRCEQIAREKGVATLRPGEITFCVMARTETDEPRRRIHSSIGLARSMLPEGRRLRVVTTLHGTDTTLLGRDAGYGPAIRHALMQSDAVTAVSAWLRDETHRLLSVQRPIDVIHNFFAPKSPRRSREEVRRELGLGNEAMIVHLSNLRPVNRRYTSTYFAMAPCAATGTPASASTFTSSWPRPSA